MERQRERNLQLTVTPKSGVVCRRLWRDHDCPWPGLAGPGECLSPAGDVIHELQDCLPSVSGQERPRDPGRDGQENQGEQREDQDRGEGDALPAGLRC